MANNLREMLQFGDVLGQFEATTTLATSIYSPADGKKGVVTTIFIANTSNVSTEYTIYLDNDGTTYDEATSLFWEITIPRNTKEAIDCVIPVASAGNLAVQAATIDRLTFTVVGVEDNGV